MKINYQNIPNKNIIDEFLPGKIISIGGNDEYIYLQLSNNIRLYKGSILPNGYKVYSLSMNTLMLIYKQNFYQFQLTFKYKKMSQLTSLERKLKQDKSGSYRDGLLFRINASKEDLTNRLNETNNSILREKIYHILNSHYQVEEIIVIIWKRYHPEVLNVY